MHKLRVLRRSSAHLHNKICLCPEIDLYHNLLHFLDGTPLSDDRKSSINLDSSSSLSREDEAADEAEGAAVFEEVVGGSPPVGAELVT